MKLEFNLRIYVGHPDTPRIGSYFPHIVSAFGKSLGPNIEDDWYIAYLDTDATTRYRNEKTPVWEPYVNKQKKL